MIKVDYKMTALSPLFTGDDEKHGFVNMFRRRTYSLKTPRTIVSKFLNSAERTACMMEVLFPIYQNIKQELKSSYYGYYEQFANNLGSAAGTPNRRAWLNRMMQLCDIAVLTDGSAQTVRSALDRFGDDEFLFVVRNDRQYLMILLREYVQYSRQKLEADTSNFEETGKVKIKNSLNEIYGDLLSVSEDLTAVKTTEEIPHIAGNSIRGIMRRQVMADFANRVGITQFKKEIYHQLFTGGNLTDKSGIEDIEVRERYVQMCPMIGLLGSAIGNQMLQSEMNVFAANLCCSEMETGKASYWELLEVDFGTRHDSSKTEKDFEITGAMKETSQMLYQSEVVVPGAVFDAKFVLTSDNAMMVSAFWHALQLFKDNGTIGAMSARGNGLIDVDYTIPAGATDLYTNFLEANKAEIVAFFDEISKEKPKKGK